VSDTAAWPSGRTLWTLVWLTAGLAVAKTARNLLPPLLPAISTDLALSPTMAGVGLSVATIAYGVVQYPGGHLSDVWSSRGVLLWGLGLVAVGAGLFVLSASVGGFLLAAGVAGVGLGIYGPADRAEITRLFARHRGLAFGINTTATDLGGIAATAIATVVIGVGLWRVGFLPVIILALLAMVVLYGRVDGPLRPRRVLLPVRATMARVLVRPPVRRIIIGYTSFEIVVGGLVGFLPTYLSVVHGYAPATAIQLYGLLFVVGLVIRPLAGRVSDRLPRPVIALLGVAVAAVGIALLVVGRGVWISALAIVLFGIGQKGFPPVMQAYLMDGFDAETMGGDLGFTRSVYLAGGALGPLIVGSVASVAGFQVAFGVLVVITLLTGIILLDVQRDLAHPT
jgi:Sugar phosphate permease